MRVPCAWHACGSDNGRGRPRSGGRGAAAQRGAQALALAQRVDQPLVRAARRAPGRGRRVAPEHRQRGRLAARPVERAQGQVGRAGSPCTRRRGPSASPWCSEVSSRPPSGRWWRNGRSTKVCGAHAAQLHADLVEAVPAHAAARAPSTSARQSAAVGARGAPDGRVGLRPAHPRRRPRARSTCRSRSRARVGGEAADQRARSSRARSRCRRRP